MLIIEKERQQEIVQSLQGSLNKFFVRQERPIENPNDNMENRVDENLLVILMTMWKNLLMKNLLIILILVMSRLA